MRKKILVLTPRFPYPPIGGDKLRIYMICEYLARAGFELTLLSFVQSSKEFESVRDNQEFKSVFSRVRTIKLSTAKSYWNAFWGIFRRQPLQISYYASKKMSALVENEFKTNHYDAVLVHLIRMAPYVINYRDVKKVIEMTDAISLNYARSKQYKNRKLLGKIYSFEEQRVWKYEKLCVNKFDAAVVVSTVDKQYLENKKVRVIPNGVSGKLVNYKPSSEYQSNLIIFMGNMRSYQNQDAVLYFIEKIFPLIKNKIPNARFRVIGSQPQRLSAFNGKNGIEITGAVNNVLNYAKNACVSVCPIRIGAGIQNKILESLAMGIPVVTSSIGLGGIPEAKNGRHLLTADEPASFAEAVLRIMTDRTLRQKLAAEGKNLIKENYSYDKKLKDYIELFS